MPRAPKNPRLCSCGNLLFLEGYSSQLFFFAVARFLKCCFLSSCFSRSCLPLHAFFWLSPQRPSNRCTRHAPCQRVNSTCNGTVKLGGIRARWAAWKSAQQPQPLLLGRQVPEARSNLCSRIRGKEVLRYAAGLKSQRLDSAVCTALCKRKELR